jgi:Flp pilus assembly protein TadG
MKSSLATRANDKRNKRRGAALVELALVLSVVAILVVGIMDFGRIAYSAMAITGAARAGAMFGAQNSANMTNFSGMKAAAESAATDIGAITDSATQVCECETGGVTSGMTQCTPPVPACGGTIKYRVRVMAKKNFVMFKSFPGLPATILIRRVVTLRAQ